jgi:hypothetical protein
MEIDQGSASRICEKEYIAAQYKMRFANVSPVFF